MNQARNRKSIIVTQFHSPFSSVMVSLRRRRRNGRCDALLGDCRLQFHPFVPLPQLFLQVVHGNDGSGLVRYVERGFLDRFRFEWGWVFLLVAICDQEQLLVPLFCCRLVLESEVVLGVRPRCHLDLAMRNHFERAVAVALNQHVCSVENVQRVLFLLGVFVAEDEEPFSVDPEKAGSPLRFPLLLAASFHRSTSHFALNFPHVKEIVLHLHRLALHEVYPSVARDNRTVENVAQIARLVCIEGSAVKGGFAPTVHIPRIANCFE